MASPVRPRQAERGFTLLELALVMLVVGILLSFATARLPSFGRTDLESSADRLAATMTYLADEASLRGRLYRLTLDLDSESWEVAALAPFAGSAPSPGMPAAAASSGVPAPAGGANGGAFALVDVGDDPVVRATSLPDGIDLQAVLARDGEKSAGRHEVWFLPEGSSDDLRVRLGEDGGATATVAYRAARGSARREDTVEASR